jgi:hypothetical protein
MEYYLLFNADFGLRIAELKTRDVELWAGSFPKLQKV